MSHLLNRRTAVLVLALVLAVSALAGYFAPVAQALPPNEVDREYYSDGTYTNLVGERWLFCNGASGGWGIITSFKIVYTYPCF